MTQIALPRLAFYLPGLAGGGAERVVLALAEAFAAAGHDVCLVLGRAEGALAGLVPTSVRCVVLGGRSTLADIPALVRYLRKERPAILMSSMGHNNVAALIAARLADRGTRVVVCQHNSLAAEAARGRPARFRLLPLFYWLTLPLADAVVAVSDGVAREMELLCKRPYGSIRTIYNPAWSAQQASLAEAASRRAPRDPGAPALILGIGRLVPQKDFATLISAFAIARTQGLRASLIILGDGPERPALQASIDALGLSECCSLPGFTARPLDLLTQADVLVLSSRYEGFGNVLVEALGCGTPVVTTNCPHGPAEIVDGGRFGALVPVADAPLLDAAIRRTATAEPNRVALRARAERFTLTRSVAGYASLFTNLLGNPNPSTRALTIRKEFV